MTTAAIYYHPEAYSISGPKLMGRNAAGESFLRGYIKHASATSFWAQVENAEHAELFGQAVADSGRPEPVNTFDRRLTPGQLKVPGLLYYPGPNMGALAWSRAMFGEAAWSLCGITHTTSSAAAMDSLSELISAPIQPWDALICTSNYVKENVTRVLQAQIDHLKDRLAISKLVLPQMPVIPLGIHTEEFSFSGGEKENARSALGIGDNDIVVLYTGRLSFHAKAHPLAMYQALEKASQTTRGRLVLVECGWHANEHIKKAYEEAQALACPSVRCIAMDGRLAELRSRAWAAADIFCSLSDNIQETFGITPIEAMAAGLPVIVSDWDGYRDTVRDGVDGFRIPTTIPPIGVATDLAYRYAENIDNYDAYCGNACALVGVDIAATAAALEKLIVSPALRKTMGEAGKARAREVFDWRHIIPQYEALWQQQAQIRAQQALPVHQSPKPNPTRLDPFYAFGSYATRALQADANVQLADNSVEAAHKRLQSLLALTMVNYARTIQPDSAELSVIIQCAAQPGATVASVLAEFTPERRAPIHKALSWLYKLGIITIPL